MALRTGFVQKHEIPGEPNEWMELRQLGWRDLDAARRARQSSSFRDLKEMGGELYKMIQENRPADTATETVDPLASYDLETVLRLGVSAWSYKVEVSPETLGQLDPQTAEWAARLIVGATPESEAARKND